MPDPLSHEWQPASRHPTSDGEVRYERCDCGAQRIVAIRAGETCDLAHPRSPAVF